MNLNNIVELFRHFPGAIGHGKSNKLRNDPDFRPQLMEGDKHSTSGYLLKLVKIVGYHPYPFDELLLMTSAFQYHKPDIIIDVGTHQGKSARIWFELTQHYGTQTTIHTIDICDPRHPSIREMVLENSSEAFR
jgi:hypothetical protein